MNSWLVLGSDISVWSSFTAAAQRHCIKAGLCAVIIWAGYQHCSPPHIYTNIVIVLIVWGPAVACRTAGTQPTCAAAAGVFDAARSLWAWRWTSSAVSHCQKQYVLYSQLLLVHLFLLLLLYSIVQHKIALVAILKLAVRHRTNYRMFVFTSLMAVPTWCQRTEIDFNCFPFPLEPVGRLSDRFSLVGVSTCGVGWSYRKGIQHVEKLIMLSQKVLSWGTRSTEL